MMGKLLKCIDDPEKVEKRQQKIQKRFKMRALETQEKMVGRDGKVFINKTKPLKDSINSAQKVTVKGFNNLIDCQNLFDKVIEGIEQKQVRKLYFVGKDNNKLFCGPVIQVIPISTFAQITSGQSTYSIKPPIVDSEFKFEKSRQIMFQVGHRIGKDFVIVVAFNGCVVMESDSYGLLNMPVYVVEPTGEYYFLNHGNRCIFLGPGSHLIAYTKQAPIIFATVQKTKRKIEAILSPKTHEESKPKFEEKKEENPVGKEKVVQKQVKPEIKKSIKELETYKTQDSNQITEMSESNKKSKEDPKAIPKESDENFKTVAELNSLETSGSAPQEPVLPVVDHGQHVGQRLPQSLCLVFTFIIAIICLILLNYFLRSH